MDIQQVIDKLKNDKENNLPDRFPCRAVMVKNISQYIELIDKLRQIQNVEIVSSELIFRGDDVFPNYEALIGFSNKNNDKWLILTGVSEYLRLFSKNEAKKLRFGKLWLKNFPADTTRGRIIIPLWDCVSYWYDKELRLMNDLRVKECYFDCTENAVSENFKMTVFSGEFQDHKDSLAKINRLVLVGMKAFYDYWANPAVNIKELALITDRIDSVSPQDGGITVRVVKDTLSFLRENILGAENLTTENCDEAMQKVLFNSALVGKNLDEAILDALNIASFNAKDVCAKWQSMSVTEKKLAMFWLKLHKDESYLHYIATGAKNETEFEQRILHNIFSSRASHTEWIAESQDIIRSMQLERDEEYFAELDKFDDYEERLDFLDGRTPGERRYILEVVGKWLAIDRNTPINSTKLSAKYPALVAYLGFEGYNEDMAAYMTSYKLHKLANTLPEDDVVHFGSIELESYEARYSALSKNTEDETCVLWVDAMGAEWLSLLLWSLEHITEGEVSSYAVTCAKLPSETKFNEQWKDMNIPYKKIDKLDKLAHKGVIDDPDYYACVEEQIALFDKITEKVRALLKEYNRVIITGDHGTSRLAARFFHKREGIEIKNGEIKSHGRYALTHDNSSIDPSTQTLAKGENGENYIVFKNYDHYKKSGFATGVDDDKVIFGEIHGGATPEEMLVPVVVINRKEPLSLTAKWEKNSVKILRQKIKLRIIFSQVVQTLQVTIDSKEGVAIPTDNKKIWDLEFDMFKAGEYNVVLVANGKIVNAEKIIVQSALGGGDGDLP